MEQLLIKRFESLADELEETENMVSISDNEVFDGDEINTYGRSFTLGMFSEAFLAICRERELNYLVSAVWKGVAGEDDAEFTVEVTMLKPSYDPS